MLTDHDVIILLRKQVQDLQEHILHMAENQQSIVKAGILTNNALMRLAAKVDEITGIPSEESEILSTRH